ncbi:WxL domain-containing protein [Enterococcus faecalis]|uniref:WxL domain-containing protein n=1 Tax=Enterococcus faecalis TaxID=1351 RepID=UPI00046C69F3|nr:WxL domain-containing protein [Enterococcus faecalis]EGO6096167.1 WxL domain-containing protein [Enterococcus faecalis]EGO6635537.1 WxL domain-containing protein [Enterococcus faecalis]EGO8953138.1 WxL domain-containing protein [Enterococcus faecalis]EGO9256005.1 WxL domain-containing protein [Enterococcus faecalis]EGO9346525.1 WxL domain-containing protein [Enterococcus faecalis]
MKKKMMASLLVGSAVVGASLAPLSAQATTTGDTPVQVEFDGGTLPDGDGFPNTVRPDPGATNSNFDLLFIPREFDFGKLSISDDLTQPIPNKTDEGLNGHTETVGVGDLRGTKEGWHVTAQSNGLKLGSESLQGSINIAELRTYTLVYREATNSYVLGSITSNPNDPSSLVSPETPVSENLAITLGGEAQLIGNAASGKGQGLWGFSLGGTTLNVTTPMQQIKAGAYTGNITWNLVAGPAI